MVMKHMVWFWLIVIGLILYVITLYNRLVTLKNRVDNAWAQIDTQLKRRYDLLPNLVETVKAYAGHEREIFGKITELRYKAMSAGNISEASQANNQLTQALRTLFALAEAYPELKANENFLKLQEELTNTENKIAFARQFYNDTVLEYNRALEMFPTNIIARWLNLTPRVYYQVPPEETGPVKVQF